MTALEVKGSLNEVLAPRCCRNQVAGLTASENPDLVIKTEPGSLIISNELRGSARQLREQTELVTEACK